MCTTCARFLQPELTFSWKRFSGTFCGLIPVEMKDSIESIRPYVVHPEIKEECEFSILELKLRPHVPNGSFYYTCD
jgi:hypothetical protein